MAQVQEAPVAAQPEVAALVEAGPVAEAPRRPAASLEVPRGSALPLLRRRSPARPRAEARDGRHSPPPLARRSRPWARRRPRLWRVEEGAAGDGLRARYVGWTSAARPGSGPPPRSHRGWFPPRPESTHTQGGPSPASSWALPSEREGGGASAEEVGAAAESASLVRDRPLPRPGPSRPEPPQRRSPAGETGRGRRRRSLRGSRARESDSSPSPATGAQDRADRSRG